MSNYKSPGVYVKEVSSGSAPIAGVGTSTTGFIGVIPDDVEFGDGTALSAAEGEPRLVTNFSEFKAAFGGFPKTPAHGRLAHAVYGFLNNGGTRAYVSRIAAKGDLGAALDALEAIDEIAIVAAPGLSDADTHEKLTTHCETLEDRFAILDSEEVLDGYATKLGPRSGDSSTSLLPRYSSYAAYYFPWIQVADPTTGGFTFVPPSGHLAGLFSRVDSNRGVHKAPANEALYGALGVRYTVTRRQQDGLNPHGVNCIRNLNGGIKVWGARTLGGDANTEFKYIGARRLFCFLRDSIDKGLQWAVFEPNDANLWAKITRNTNAFLRGVWEAGALFGSTPEEAFYVKCDAETNPPEKRDLGMVTTQIGVALTRPAEFVIFNIGQWAGPGK